MKSIKKPLVIYAIVVFLGLTVTLLLDRFVIDLIFPCTHIPYSLYPSDNCLVRGDAKLDLLKYEPIITLMVGVFLSPRLQMRIKKLKHPQKKPLRIFS